MIRAITYEFNKIKIKNKTTQNEISNLINELKDNLVSCEKKLNAINESESEDEKKKKALPIIEETISKVNAMDIDKNYNAICNGFYGSLSKLGKIMQNDFGQRNNIDSFNLYPYDKKLFYTIIAKDLYRRGDFKTSDSLIKEANLDFSSSFRFIFKDLNLITRDLKNHIIETLSEWCVKYKTLLDNMKSRLPFECLKLQYILKLNDKSILTKDCVIYCKKEFQQYLTNHNYYDEISKLMTLLIFRNNPISKCPYKEYEVNDLWNKVSTLFINDCCTILNLPSESGFYLSIVSGMISLPQILKAESILKSKKEMLNEKELPYEIQLPNQLKFHNLFICPVSKEISTPDNPPMLLTCGHCISQNALEKMQRSGTNSQIKCPTCPNTQSVKDAQKLFIF